jgi:hypothetical protein
MRVWRTILGFVEMYLTGGQPVSEVSDKPAVPSGHPDVAQTLSNLAGHYREWAEKQRELEEQRAWQEQLQQELYEVPQFEVPGLGGC